MVFLWASKGSLEIWEDLHTNQRIDLLITFFKGLNVQYTNSSEKRENGNSEDKATQMAHKQTNYMKDPEATLKLPIQLPRECARLPDVANENVSSTVHQRNRAAWWSKTAAKKINILSKKTIFYVEKYKILTKYPAPMLQFIKMKQKDLTYRIVCHSN